MIRAGNKPRKKKGLVRWCVGFAFKIALFLSLLPVAGVGLLRYVDPPVSAFMIRDRLTTHADETDPRLSYVWVEWTQISPAMRLAVVAAEDQKFPLHQGFDMDSIKTVLKERVEAENGVAKSRGASTISQQLAKNLFLWPGRSWLRKGIEAYCTLLLELMLPKQRILELYLNVVQFGDNVYGVGAAASLFYTKTPAELSIDEAALLAAVLPNPVRYKVESPSSYIRKRQKWIKRQMRQLGGESYLENL